MQEKGKGMNGEKYVRMAHNGPLKRAERQLQNYITLSEIKNAPSDHHEMCSAPLVNTIKY
jgi:hypothetical protein